MDETGRDGGFQLLLTGEAYAAWKKVAESQGMTTAGLLEMIGRHLARNHTLDVNEALEASQLRLSA